MKNLEIKVKFEDLSKLKKLMAVLGAELMETMHQIDTHFSVPQGRLKLRELGKLLCKKN